MSISTSSLSANPFNYTISRTPNAFGGRQKELETISEYLRGDSPRCCAIIGESYIGKTSLLRYLTHPQGAITRAELEIENLLFVYLDASVYIDYPMVEHASLQFWWDLLQAFQARLDPAHSPKQPLPKFGMSKNPIDKAFEIKSNIERLISAQRQQVIFALDNFQGIASLPLSDSAWLRGMTTDYNCAYVVTSRYLLHLLYNSKSWDRPSPLWNLFTDRVYLSLLSEEDAMNLIFQRGKLTGFWREEDITFIKKVAGRHPALLRMACAVLYDRRQQTYKREDIEEYDALEARIYRDASPICNQLWYGLADPELLGISRSVDAHRETLNTSIHQKVLMDIVHNNDSMEDHQYIFELEERGFIERIDGKWQIFAGIMYQFVLRQEQVRRMTEIHSMYATVIPTSDETTHVTEKISNKQATANFTSTQAKTQAAFTYLEGKVYQYLQAHLEEVCDKEEIKRTIWGEERLPSDSTVQKIIERIRRKIEPDPDNPRFLIAVRGQGYILRESQTEGK